VIPLLRRDEASGGVRVLALTLAAVLDSEARQQVRDLDTSFGDENLFAALDRLRLERNSVVHVHSGAEEIGGVGFRMGILILVREFSRVLYPAGADSSPAGAEG
jgi:hypothetical protein